MFYKSCKGGPCKNYAFLGLKCITFSRELTSCIVKAIVGNIYPQINMISAENEKCKTKTQVQRPSKNTRVLT